MKIELSKQQYKDLVASVAMADTICGLLSDAIEDGEIDYKERAEQIGELQSYLLQFADEFEYGEAVEEYDGEIFMDEELYEEEIEPIMDDFEDFVLHDRLPNILAWRDFYRDHSDEEREKMSEENGGYFGVELHPYEAKYWNEFDEHGFEHLFIKEEGNEKGTPSPYL